MSKIDSLGLFSLAFLAIALTGCTGSEAKSGKAAAAMPDKPAAIAVKVAAAESRGVTRTLDVTGTLVPDDSLNVVSEVPGKIVAIRYDFGQSVKKGDVLVELDRQEYQIQVDRARAALAQALARIGLNPDQENETPTTTPLIRQAKAQLEDAKSKLDNARKLHESGDIARERFLEAEKLVNGRQASVDAAEDDLRTGLANVQAIRADKRLAEKRLGDTTIRAPFDGQIANRNVAPGQYIKDNVTLLTLVKTWPLRLHVDVPEVGVSAVRVGESLSFVTESIPGRTFSATVTQMNPALETRSRSLSVEARLTRPDPMLKPGMFVQVKLVLSRNAAVTMVPRQAIYTIAGLSKAFVIRGSVAHEVRFTPGQVLDDWIEVPGDAGIQSGDTVAMNQLSVLTDGSEVRVDGTAQRPAAPSAAKGE